MKYVLGAMIIGGMLGPARVNGIGRPEMPQPRVVGFYGSYNSRDVKTRLDAFVAALRQNPYVQGYIMVYAGKRALPGEAAARGRWAKESLSGVGGVDATHIVVRDEGYREEWTVELWMVPSGGLPPSPRPTVDPNEVRITGGSAKGRRRQY